ncbi:FG-GAP-like repeat-containing protein [Streptomyces sp. S.PB5]|uniref:FG-GAP-like repeat-containing protein n=1 Tax=Streptomyces sp. S.PB5 TaxID=3020844 RepID=UPI0025B03DCF|nr:FG-GAP-like repeat-containing protein [Streptomyces sp. S.PB5]MDN3022936.1 FG-GAP-like repeat-containing protein [Streptomyces sp. S.PB5]
MSLPAASRRTRRAVVVAIALIAATCGALPVAQAQPTAAAPASASAGAPQDFNGDGYGDLAVAAPHATVGGKAEAGYVAVLYGSASGLRTTAKKVYTQASAEIPGTPETGDRFGSLLLAADLDGDGYTDLSVQAEGEQWTQGGIARKGNRTILWGGSGGLTSGKVIPARDSGTYQSGGDSVTGDFNGDGHQDLLHVGNVYLGPFGRDGVPASVRSNPEIVDGDLDLLGLVAGDIDGDGVTDLVTMARSYDGDDEGDHGEHLNYLRGGRDGLQPLVVLKDAQGEPLRPGHDVALGDVNGDHRADIVTARGSLRFVPGTANGPATSFAPQSIDQDTPGVPGAEEPEDWFGYDLSVADVNGDGYGDVLAGNPYEDLGTVQRAGAFTVVPGGKNGPTGAGSTLFSQNSANVPGAAEKDDRFGENTAFVDGNGDGKAEPVVAAIAEDSSAGAVWVFRGAATATGSFSFGAGTLGTTASRAWLGAEFPR